LLISNLFPVSTLRQNYLLVFAVDQSELEFVLSWVDVENARLALPVQAVDLAALDFGQVNGHVDCADDSVITEKRPVKKKTFSSRVRKMLTRC
jgi:hypothetical protein